MLNETAIEQIIWNAWDVKKHFQHKIVGASPGWLDDLIASLAGVIRSIGDKIGEQLNKIVSPIENVANKVESAISGFVNGIREKLDSIKDKIVQGLGEKVDAVRSTLSTVVSSATSSLSTSVQSLGDRVAGWLSGIQTKINGVIDKIHTTAQEVGDKVGSWVNSAISSVVNSANDIWQKVTGALSSLQDKVSQSAKELGEKISTTIATIIAKIKEALDKIQEALAKAIADALDWAEDNILKPLSDTFDNAREHLVFKEQVLLKASLGHYTSFDDFARDILDPIPVLGALGAILGALLVGSVVAPGISSALSPAFENLTHLTAQKFQSSRLMPHDAIMAYFKGGFGQEKLYSEMLDQGFHKSRVDALVTAMRPVPDVTALETALWRGLMPDGKIRNKIRAMGYSEEDVDLFLSLMKRLPPLNDIIRMAVREAFTPEIAQRFGQYEDYPAVLTDYAQQQGLSEEWAKRYWAAHWDLPSATMGFEMYHRGIITYEELKGLLRALDVMPFWRDKLIELSTTLPARVDVRRLYATGVYTQEDVYQAYKKLGYSDKDAKALTQFTIENYSPEEETEKDRQRNLTSSIILAAYKRGFIGESEAKANLVELGYSDLNAQFMLDYTATKDAVDDVERTLATARTAAKNTILKMYKTFTVSADVAIQLLLDMGYSQDEADTLLATVELEREFERREAYLNVVKDVYISGTVDKVSAIGLLSKIHLSGAEQEFLLNTWDNERARKTRHATEAQYRAAVKAKIITVDEYKTLLANAGYADYDIELLAKLLERG